MVSVRQFILGLKRKGSKARSQFHYMDLIQTYLTAKRQVIQQKISSDASKDCSPQV